jgi:hypothetical protein
VRSIPIFGLLLMVIACGSQDVGGIELSTPQPSATSKSVAQDETTATVESQSDRFLDSSFDSAEFLNGEDAEEFIREVGREKVYPSALMNGAPTLSENEARELVVEYLSDTRVVLIEEGFRGSNIELIMDFCDNGVREKVFIGFSVKDIRDRPGNRLIWSVEHTGLTQWNSPYITGSHNENRTGYLATGWDATNPDVLWPPDSNGKVRLGPDRNQYIRVFDHPECPDPQPVLTQGADQWQLLGLGEMIEFPEVLRDTEPRATGQELEQIWTDVFTDLVSFSNLEGYPIAMWCANGTGMILSPYAEDRDYGREWTWHMEDASDIHPNSIWIVYHLANDGVEKEFLTVANDDSRAHHLSHGDHRRIVAARTSDCDLEKGAILAEQVKEDFGIKESRR